MQSISLADELTLERAPDGRGARTRSSARGCRRRRRRTSRRARCAAFRAAHRLGRAAAAAEHRQADPGGRRAGGRLGRRRGGAAPGRPRLGPRRRGAAAGELAAQLGADVPAQVSPGRWLASGAGERLQRAAGAEPRRSGCSCCRSRPSCRRRRCTPRPTGSGLGARARARASGRRALARRSSAARRCRPRSELLHNDLQRAAVSLCPEIAGALGAGARGGRGRGARERLGPDRGRAVPRAPTVSGGPSAPRAGLSRRDARADLRRPVDADCRRSRAPMAAGSAARATPPDCATSRASQSPARR